MSKKDENLNAIQMHPLVVPLPTSPPKCVLVVDVGGSHVKFVTTREGEERKFVSGPKMTATEMAEGVKRLAGEWTYDVVSIGYPGPVLHGKPLSEPFELGKGWVTFDFESAFKCPVKVINDATMQAIGSYRGGKMLFLGLGTGLGSTMIADGMIEPMEIGHLPYKTKTYEDYLGKRGLKRCGKKRWRKNFADIVEKLTNALEPEYVVVGGGNSSKLHDLPENCELGENSNAFIGGFRMWGQKPSAKSELKSKD